MIKIKYLSFVIILLIVNTYCSNDRQPVPENFPKTERLLNADVLENAGFEHLAPNFFELLINREFTYILNSEDKMIARYNGEKIDKIYKRAGQGPGEMLNPSNAFLVDDYTIAIFDGMKGAVLFLDFDLNLKDEIAIPSSIRKLSKINGQIMAFGDFDNGIFARFDEAFNRLDTFGSRNRTMPFKNLFPASLYMGYLLNSGEVADTSWLHVHSTCKVDIIDGLTKEKKVSLQWKHPSPPTQGTINSRKNFYSSYYTGKHGKYYVVHNSFSTKFMEKGAYDLLIFDEQGKHLRTYRMPDIQVVHAERPGSDSRIYLIDDDCNLYYLGIDQLI